MRISARVPANPATVKNTDSASEASSVVLTAVFIRLYSCAPNRLEMTTEHPMLLPAAMAIKIMVMG